MGLILIMQSNYMSCHVIANWLHVLLTCPNIVSVLVYADWNDADCYAWVSKISSAKQTESLKGIECTFDMKVVQNSVCLRKRSYPY